MTTKDWSDLCHEDFFDIRDVIERFEELESSVDDEDNEYADDDREELAKIEAFIDDVRGNGGDHEWRGDWYPLIFVEDSHWEDFARQEAEDIYGKEISNARWPNNCIDWEEAASQLQMDYSSVEIDGKTFWYR